MSQWLRKLLTEREAEVRTQMSALQKELRDLAKVREALYIDPPRPPGTIQQLALASLRASKVGLTARGVRETVSRRYGRPVDRTSIAPQLSRLKARGLVRHRNGRWFANLAAKTERLTE